MGGAAAGEIASQLAVDIIYERMIDGARRAARSTRDELARRLVRAVEAAGLRIFQEAKLDRTRRGMGTTVTAAALVDDHLFFAPGRRLARLHPARRHARAGHARPVARQPAHRGRPAHRRRGRDLRAQQHHPAGARHGRHRAGRPHVRASCAAATSLLLCSDGLSGHGALRRDPRGPRGRRPSRSTPARRSPSARTRPAATTTSPSSSRSSTARASRPLAPDAEPLKYRKYALPEEPADADRAHRRQPLREMAPTAPRRARRTPGPAGDQDPCRAPGPISPSARPSARPAGSRGGPWHEEGPHAPCRAEAEERIDIPGTHVPAWVVVAHRRGRGGAARRRPRSSPLRRAERSSGRVGGRTDEGELTHHADPDLVPRDELLEPIEPRLRAGDVAPASSGRPAHRVRRDRAGSSSMASAASAAALAPSSFPRPRRAIESHAHATPDRARLSTWVSGARVVSAATNSA